MKNLLLIAALLVSSLVFAQEARENSDQLIARALAKREITLDQSWQYRMLARFDHEALPAKFKGPQDQVLDHIHTELTDAITTLSAATQQELVGYFVPPVYPESKFKSMNTNKDNDPVDPPGGEGWQYIETSELRIWWDKDVTTDEAYARRVADIAPGVIRKLEALTGKKLLSDAGTHEFRNLEGKRVVWGDNGNGKYDIFVGNLKKDLALTVPYPPGCSQVPSFMMIRRTMLRDQRDAEATLAHEFMHAFQYLYDHGFDCKQYIKIEEGTAHWAIQYIFPKNNFERRDDSWFQKANWSLGEWSYDTWPFYLFMEKTIAPSAIPAIFQNFGLQMPMEAVNAVLPGGFAKQFPEYTIREWNRTNLVEGFQEWDELDWVPVFNAFPEEIPVVEVKVDDDGDFKYEKEMSIKPLARQYFNFKFTDKTIRSIQFSATMGWEQTKKVRLKALIRKGQAWVQEDWSNKIEAVQYCQDKIEDRMDEVVLIFSNIDHQKQGDNGVTVNTGFQLEATNIACDKLQGHFKSTFEAKNPSLSYSVAVSANVVFAPGGVDEENIFKGQFHAVSGEGSFTYIGSMKMGDATCNANTTQSFKVVAGKKNVLGIYPHHVISPNSRKYTGSVAHFAPETFMVQFVCPPGKPPVTLPFAPVAWSVYSTQTVNRDGKISGTSQLPANAGVTSKFEWTIVPVQQ